MNITQSDARALSDHELKRAAVACRSLAIQFEGEQLQAASALMMEITRELVHVMTDRRTTLLVAEAEMLNDDELNQGCIVESPEQLQQILDDARDQLRGPPPTFG